MTEAMSCPVCRVPLVMSERQGVEIDYCPQCRGVWLDRGELDKIIERGARDARPADPRQAPVRGQPDRDDDYGYGRDGDRGRKRSFLEDLFD